MSTRPEERNREPDAQKEEVRAPGSGGIFLTRGSQLRVNEFSIDLSDEGELSGSDLTLGLAQDVTPFWLDVALAHCRAAGAHHAAVHERIRVAEDQALADALEAEFMSSMQACVAAAIAVDAFYGRVKEFVPVPPETAVAWRENGTARHAQIAEVLRMGCRIHQSKVAELKRVLKQVFEWRDLAVHPPPRPERPVLRPDLRLGLEWRFVTFRLHNARATTRLCVDVVWSCSGVPRTRYGGLAEYCRELRTRVGPLRSKYRNLLDTETEEVKQPE